MSLSARIEHEMDIAEEILKNKQYKEQIDKLNNETLLLIAKDPVKALEAAQEGIKQVEPDKVDDVEYLQSVANAMQKLTLYLLTKNPK